ncbi:MAG: metal ABC transporter permease [Thermoanaerobaculales bacterium]|nr:metal ABC transporter permease [Thermoanaerobaculales bacterium]
MSGFFADAAVNPFLWTGLVAGLLAGVGCAVVGPYVITRRLVFLAGAMAHIAIGGVGAAIYLSTVHPAAFGWLEPIHGGLAAALASAPLLAILHHRVSERLDTVVGALWAVGMSVGILLIKITPGYHTELMSYLFGNISFVTREDLVFLAVLSTTVVVVAAVFHRRFLALCLDAEQAELRGVPVLATEIVLFLLIAATVIVLTQIVGLILVIALLSLPAAVGARLTTRIGPSMVVAFAVITLATTIPRIAVYGTVISPEAAIVLATAGLYLVVSLKRHNE